MSHHDHGHSGGHDDHGHGVGHIVSNKILAGTGLALLLLTWLTVAVAGFDLGEANIFVALGVAVVKSTFVALFFMHLRWDRPFNAIIFVGSLAFVALFLAFAMLDTAEYQDILIKGDTEKVKQALDAARAAAATVAPAAGH